MRTFDLSPLYRSTIGFDRLFSMLDQVPGYDGGSRYPPYNIERTGENAYRISVAVAGFTESELSIEAKANSLTIKGEKQAKTAEAKRIFLGILQVAPKNSAAVKGLREAEACPAEPAGGPPSG